MRDISEVAGQLREVRAAQRRFLSLWATEEQVILPALDRVAADVERITFPTSSADPCSAHPQ